MIKRLTIPNIILFTGFILAQTCLLYHFVQTSNLSYSPWIQDGFFYTCTFLQIVAFISFLKLKPFKYYSHAYQFILLPFFSINFLKQGNFKDQLLPNAFRLTVFIIGWILSLIMAITEYTRYNEEQSQNIMRISTNLRILKLIKRLVFVTLIGLHIIISTKTSLIFMFAISIIQFYVFLTTFSFQNPFHQYLLMLSTFSSMISWLDFTFSIQKFSTYSYIGQFFFILVVVVEPQLFQKAIEFKYQIYGEKNIETRNINEILAFFIVMKQIILNQHQTFQYTIDFDNKMHLLLQKMTIKSKLQSQGVYQDKTHEQKYFLKEYQRCFLKVLQKRFKQNNQFIAYDFYLTTIMRKGLSFQNKALTVYYERQNDKKNSTSNLFTKIEMQLLYNNLINRINRNKKHDLHHQTLVFCDFLHQLKTKIIELCKNQISIVNLFQNSLNIPVQKYSYELILRYEMKYQIKTKIDKLNKNSWHIYSGDFLYFCLLYKIIFQRQQKIIQQKINKNFTIPIAIENKKSKFQLCQNKSVSIVVFSSMQKGQILNQNEQFSKIYGKSVRSGQKSRKYISDLFPSLKQKICHQQILDKTKKYQDLQMPDHSVLACWIKKKVLIKQSKFNEEDALISVLQKVKISTRIYYEMSESEAYICSIEPLDSQIGIKVLKDQIELIKKYESQFELLKQQVVTQLNQEIQIFHILIKQWQNSVMDQNSSDQKSQINISENLIFTFNQQSFDQKKFLKIQKEYDKQEIKFCYRKISILVAIFFAILSYLITVAFVQYVNGQIQQSNTILKFEKQIFQKTLLSQKYMGLHLIIFQLVDQGLIIPSMCSKYGVNNLKQFAVNNLRKSVQNSFDEMQISHIQGTQSRALLMDLFNQKLYKFFDLKDMELIMNYIKYVSLTKSAVFEYASTIGQITLNNWCRKSIKNAINISQLDINGLFTNLRIKFQQSFTSLVSLLNSSLVLLIIVNSIIFVFILSVFYRLIGYKYVHIMLLQSFKRQFIQGRIRQMDFILSQISKLQKNQIVNVKISKSMNITMVKNNQQKIIDLIQFQKQSFVKIPKNGGGSSKSISVVSSSQLDQEKQKLLQTYDQQNDKKQKSSLLIMLSFHKYKALVLLALFVACGVLNVVHNQLLRQKSTRNMKMQETFFQMSNLVVAMNDLLIGEVIKYSDQQIYSTKGQNQVRISKALNEIQTNPFQQKIFNLFPKSVSDFILYSSYCKTQLNYTNCQKVKSGILQNGLSPIVSFLPIDYNATWENKLSQNVLKIKQNQVCQKLIIFVNYTVNQFQSNLIQGYETIHTGLNYEQNQFNIAKCIMSTIIIFGIGIMANIIIERGRKVRNQVLSMDTKRNLYKHQQKYRPFLNKLYYIQQKDQLQ